MSNLKKAAAAFSVIEVQRTRMNVYTWEHKQQRRSIRFKKGTNIWEVLLDGRFNKEEKPFFCSTFVSKIHANYFILLRLIKEIQ